MTDSTKRTSDTFWERHPLLLIGACFTSCLALGVLMELLFTGGPW